MDAIAPNRTEIPHVRFTTALIATLLFATTACSHQLISDQHDDDARCNPQMLTPQQIERIALSQLGPEWQQALYVATARQANNHWAVLMRPKEVHSPGDEWFELIDFCGKPIGSMASH